MENAKQGKKYPMRGMRKLHRIGGGYAIFIPIAWFNAHKLDPTKLTHLPLDANRHIVIVNPNDAEKEYEKFSEEIQRKMGEDKSHPQGDVAQTTRLEEEPRPSNMEVRGE